MSSNEVPLLKCRHCPISDNGAQKYMDGSCTLICHNYLYFDKCPLPHVSPLLEFLNMLPYETPPQSPNLFCVSIHNFTVIKLDLRQDDPTFCSILHNKMTVQHPVCETKMRTRSSLESEARSGCLFVVGDN